jgi:hypothetical protein
VLAFRMSARFMFEVNGVIHVAGGAGPRPRGGVFFFFFFFLGG